ncbi:MAG TPA: peptide ABC transporter substrate-binding protein [Anaerolineales bacterium]|nr:peptide ABC transporter substrate-binding protein [Anaerolineales bacterium]
MSLRRSALIALNFLAILVMLAACSQLTARPGSTPSPAAATPTPTPAPPRLLTVCLGQEPASLFPLNNPSSVARSVLAAVYDGPINTNSYGYQAVILKDLPSLANGDAQLFKKSVQVGDEIVDATGTPVTLAPGVKVHPAGCRDDSCAVQYDGKSSLEMDQMQVTFRLLPGLTWSDGQPLTAADSVYAFTLASDPSIGGSTYLVDRTKSYEAVDDTTVQWWGKPGYIDSTYFTNFWTPLPKHSWSQIEADKLTTADATARKPLGWGPYVIQDWVAGDHITLTRNPHYFRINEGLPKFDTLTFRFVPDPATAVSDLVAGSCDILDPSIPLDGQVGVLRSMAGQGQLQALFVQSPVMEQLAFGIKPASYENGFNSGYDRPAFFNDARLRQAVAMCIDRQKIVDTVLSGLTSVPASFVPATYPLANPAAQAYSYDVAAANALLDQAGWRNVSNDLSKPRQGWNIKNVPNGTPLVLNYITTGAAQRVQVATIVADSLAQCGIQVNVKYLDQTALYAPGPDGPLFGRNFDLAEFAVGSTSVEPSCDWFSTSQVPTAANDWIGLNVSGYSNPAYDAACQSAQLTLPDEPEHAAAYSQAQSIFVQDMPVIPLYWRVRTAAARPDVCHFSLDPTAASALWNIAAYDSGSGCQP